MSQLRSHPRLVRKLQEALGDQLCVALEDSNVVEIMLNPDGKLFIERLGHGIAAAGEMSPASAEMVIGAVAHALQSEVDVEQPIISGELPIGGHRFEGLLPPVVAKPTFTIRRRASRLIPLDEYVGTGVMTTCQAETIRSAISSRLNIIISGGTGSGKTTLANAVLQEIVKTAPDDRLVILEDTAEIQCSAENAVLLHTSGGIDMGRLLKSTMRLRPDRIIVGEVRDGAALTLLKAWNTGHPGGVATIHSNTAMSALRRLLTVDAFDAVILTGGHEAPDRVRQDRSVLEFVREMADIGKVVAGLCHGPWIMVSAGVLRGKTACAYIGLRDDVINAGANVIEGDVVVDGNIITCSYYAYVGKFMKTVFEVAETIDTTFIEEKQYASA